MTVSITEFSKFHTLLTAQRKDYNPYYIKLEKGGKNPTNEQWKLLHTNEGHTYKDALAWMAKGFNTGIVATDRDPLVIIDIDNLEKITDIKPTLRTRSRKRAGLHNFYFTTDKDTKVIIPTGGNGEVRSRWAFVVTAGSSIDVDFNKNPKDKELYDSLPPEQKAQFGLYTVDNELPVADITFDEFPVEFKERYKKEKDSKNRSKMPDAEYEKFVKEHTENPNQSAIYKLKIENLIGHHDPSERFHSPLHDSSTDANSSVSEGVHNCWRHYVAHSPLQLLGALAGVLQCEDAGKGHNGRSESQLNLQDGETLYRIWEYAKKEGMIPIEDKPPAQALAWFAISEKICDASDIEDGWKIKNKDKRIQALLKLKEQNLIDGWCVFCFKNKPIGNGVQCQECVDETINSNSDKNSKSDKKPIDDGKYDYESFDDVPLPEEEKIAPISFDGLPEYSIIKQYVEYVATISDTYPEYSFQNGIGMLSAIQERKMYTRFNSKKEFLNLWQISLGLSTYARKTASFSLSQRILRKAVGNIFLPEDTTPEGFLIEMADELEKNNKNGKDEPEIEIKYNGERRRALCALWMDEAGQFLAQANKPHMLSFKQMMCKFYDSPDNYEKKLVSMRIRIGEIYFPMNMATTPTSFFDNITKSDIGTGFLPRFNITSPSYDKKRKGIIQNSINDEETENYFTEVIRLIHKLLPEEPLQVVLNDECIGLLDAWCAEREAYFKKTGNEVMSSFQGRFQANVIKYAILIELSNLPYYLLCKYTSEVDSSQKKIDNSQLEKNATLDEKPDKKCELSKNISKQDQIDDGKIYIKFNEIVHQKSLPFLHKDSIIKDILSNNNNNYKDICISKFTVSIPSLMYAIKLFDSVFIPYSFQVCVREASGIFVNYLSNIYKILQIQRKISHTDLLRSSHATKREFEEAIESLIESGSCIVYKVKGKTKPQKVYVYVQPKLEKFNFKDSFQIPQKDSSQDNSQENFCIELSKKSKKSMTSINCQEYNLYIIGTGRNFNDIIVTAISYKKDTESAGVLTSIILKPESKNTTIEPPLRENWYSASLPLVEKPDGRECTVSHKTVFTPIPQLINVSSEQIQLIIESIPKRTLNEIKSNPSRTKPIKTLNGGAQVVDYLDMMRCEVAIIKTYSGKSKKDTDVCIYTVTDDSLSNNDKFDQYGDDGRIIKYGGVSVFMEKSLYSKLNLDVNSIVEIIGTAKINTKSGSLEINAVVVKPIVKICKKIPTPQKIESNGINHLITFNLETETLSENQPTTPMTPIICPEIRKLNDSSIKVSDL